MKRVNYRRIWEQANGPIPREASGRQYHIHHRDGDRSNNSLENLQCVTASQHYDIHFARGDWAACHFLTSQHITKTPEEISQLQRLRLAAGTHPLQGLNNPCHAMILAGTHPFQGGALQRATAQRRIAQGTHNWLGHTNYDQCRVNGLHPTQVRKTCEHCGRSVVLGTYARYHGPNCSQGGSDYNKSDTPYTRQRSAGRHPSQIKNTCEHCGRTFDLGNYTQWHGDRCRFRKEP